MKIEFSRHAERRAKLYRISRTTIESILSSSDLEDGEHELIRDINGFKYPIKIVVAVEKDVRTVITNYPLKRGREK